MATFQSKSIQSILFTLTVAIAAMSTLHADSTHAALPAQKPHLAERVFPTSETALSQKPSEVGDFPKGSRPGGTRGGCSIAPKAFPILLFQEQEDQVISGRPTLFWYLSAKTPAPARVVLLDLEESEVVFEQVIDDPEPGFQQVTLPTNLELIPERTYRWSVVLVCNPSRPSENLIAQGQIQRVSAPPLLTQQLARASFDRQRSQIYAQNGFWYEALATIMAAHNAQPQDSAIREEIFALLKRMGHTWVVQQEQQSFQQ